MLAVVVALFLLPLLLRRTDAELGLGASGAMVVQKDDVLAGGSLATSCHAVRLALASSESPCVFQRANFCPPNFYLTATEQPSEFCDRRSAGVNNDST